jgi:hypothetical protein
MSHTRVYSEPDVARPVRGARWQHVALGVLVIGFYVALVLTHPPNETAEAVVGTLAFLLAWRLARRWGPLNPPGQEPIAVMLAAFLLFMFTGTFGGRIPALAAVPLVLGFLTTQAIWAVNRYPADRAAPRELPVAANIRWGVGWGIAMAAIFTVYVAALFVVFSLTRKHNMFADATLPLIAAAYFAGGIGGGFIAGVLRPAMHWPLARMAVGILVAFPVYEAVGAVLPYIDASNRGMRFKEQVFIGFACALFAGPPAALSMRAKPES